MNKELIELQKGCVATCAIIPNEEIDELNSKVIIQANASNEELMTAIMGCNCNNGEEVNHLVIKGIDNIPEDSQEKFYQIVKDREFNGCKLKEEIIIVLTVEGKDNLKKISDGLYNLCVVAF